MEGKLPEDPFMLYSVINTKLRDRYPSLAALCEDLDISPEALAEKLAAAGFHYEEESNQFR